MPNIFGRLAASPGISAPPGVHSSRQPTHAAAATAVPSPAGDPFHRADQYQSRNPCHAGPAVGAPLQHASGSVGCALARTPVFNGGGGGTDGSGGVMLQQAGVSPPKTYASGAAPKGPLALGAQILVGKRKFIVDRHLAEGGFAHVYVGRLESGEAAVLKRIMCPDSGALAVFLNEIEIMQKLSAHPKIVQYYDSHVSPLQEGFEVLIVMEYCSGGPVIDLMNRRLHNRLTEPEILHMFSDIVEAVAHMHYMVPPIVHRDLKVENVLLNGAGGYKLCDFGSATSNIIAPRVPLSAQDVRRLEEEISRQTTLQYRAPEMIDLYQKRGITEKADIWVRR